MSLHLLPSYVKKREYTKLLYSSVLFFYVQNSMLWEAVTEEIKLKIKNGKKK